MSAPDEGTDRLADQVTKAAERLGQLRARQLLRQMRIDTRAREQARREAHRRRLEIGAAVLEAGFDLPAAHIVARLRHSLALEPGTSAP